MMRSGQCPKCQSKLVITNARVRDATDGSSRDLHVSTYEDPSALMFKGEHRTNVGACVCTHCGYMELYADDPKRLILPES